MNRIFLALALALTLPALVLAQAAPAATTPAQQQLLIAFVDDSSLTATGTVLAIVDDKGAPHKFGATPYVEGYSVPLGWTIQTGSESAELQLMPNKSIIKLAKGTTFKVKALAGAAGGGSTNAFAVLAGKIRTVAAKGTDNTYTVNSQTAICAVRGTDFTFDAGVDGSQASQVFVQEGEVGFDKLDPSIDPQSVFDTAAYFTPTLGKGISVATGQAADAFAATFAAFKMGADQLGKLADMQFKNLKETEVPGHNTVGDTTPPPDKQTTADKNGGGDKSPPPESEFVKALKKILGFEIGSVTINGTTYSKAVIQPNLEFGKIKLGLYLPIIYSSDLFNPADWYHPGGNDEWSFGMGLWNSDPLAAGLDFARDLALKIKYFEYGDQLKFGKQEPFFVKVGNLEGLTVGHGIIMRNYANDADFPAVRRVGFNLGVDGGGGGFEFVANDLADLSHEIAGTRLFVRPIPNFDLSVAVSAVIDTAPGADLAGGAASVGNMMLIGGGLDMDLPIITSDLLTLRMFADGGATVPYVRDAFSTVSAGLQYQLLWDGSALKNWGAEAGIIGKLLFLDWRLEYRYFTGIFRPAFFDSTYDRLRGSYAQQYANYLDGTSQISNTPDVMGIYGEGGFKLLNDKLLFTLGYMWPWSLNASLDQNLVNGADEFHAKLTVIKGLLPLPYVEGMAGSIIYDRRGLVNAITKGNFQLIDANTVFSGELVMPVPNAPMLDLALLFSEVPKTSNGVVILDSITGLPSLEPSVSIETRVHL